MLFLVTDLYAQGPRGHMIYDQDSVPAYVIPPAVVSASKRNERQYNRMVENLKLVYPIAKEANRILEEMERRMARMSTEREQKEFTKEVERMLQQYYEPIIRKMTYSQGKLLIKLIDRETSRTSYTLLKDLRGSLRAFMWQSVARLFGADLKDTYDPYGDDWVIEELISMYEMGLL